jgi:hypothetical protein
MAGPELAEYEIEDVGSTREPIRSRDALRDDSELAAEDEELKRNLLERGPWYRGVDKREPIERVLAE